MARNAGAAMDAQSSQSKRIVCSSRPADDRPPTSWRTCWTRCACRPSCMAASSCMHPGESSSPGALARTSSSSRAEGPAWRSRESRARSRCRPGTWPCFRTAERTRCATRKEAHSTSSGRANASEPVESSHPTRGDGARTTLVAGSFRLGAAPGTAAVRGASAPHPRRADDALTAPSLASTVQLLIAESASSSPGATVIMSRLADILLVQALRTHIAGSECRDTGCRALADPRWQGPVGSFMRDPQPWTVESLRRPSPCHGPASPHASARSSESLLEYLSRWRMTKAAQLLRERRACAERGRGDHRLPERGPVHRAFKRWGGVLQARTGANTAGGEQRHGEA